MTKRLRLSIALLCAGILLGGACTAAKPEKAKAKKETKQENSSSLSFIIVGDTHYDKLEDHYMPWLEAKPGDLRQVTGTYVPNTENNWKDLMGVLRGRVQSVTPPVKAVVQLGDVSEGLAGSEEKAVQMATSAMTALRESNMGAPWILAKGNHDITGPGAKEAFTQVYVPYMREQSGVEDIANASYSYRLGNAHLVFVDPWDSMDMAAFIEKEFASSDAKYKFVCIHEPIIPVTERCWHYMRNKPDKRAKLLEAIAKNQAIVLTAHLHRYSVVKRETDFGPIVQVMAVSVIGKKRLAQPTYNLTIKDYGAALVDRAPKYEPGTADARRKMLSDEAPFVTYYTMCDLAGYGIISIDDAKGEVTLNYYAGFESAPFDTVNLTKLQKGEK